MSETTGIQWTEATWNPWHGCHKVSAECDYCYMFTEKKQYGQDGDIVVRSKTKFIDPLRWVKAGNPPKMCFTCSWSDWFIREADEWRPEAWDIIRRTPQITYQILTKRAGRIAPHLPHDWGDGWDNVWLGVSVGVKMCRPRIATLRKVRAKVRFVSFEPLLEDVGEVNLQGIHWAIIGGESGPKARPMSLEWARKLIWQCQQQGVKVFVKQLGAKPVDTAWRSGVYAPEDKRAIAAAESLKLCTPPNLILLNDKRKGGEIAEWPEDLRVREFPERAIP